MKSHTNGRGPRRSRGGPRRRSDDRSPRHSAPAKAPAQKSFWQKVAAFFSPDSTKEVARSPRAAAPVRNGSQANHTVRPARKPESVEVTTPRLYVGNLSFDATESDLFELFNGVGQVQNAEVVSYKHNQRSKGFAFVQMQTTEEAQRAVSELHDKEFLGRKLVVSGAKSSDHQTRD